MIVLLLAQEFISKSFLGGTGQDLAVFYSGASKRSVVCSEKVVQAYGPCRFSIDQNKYLNPADSMLGANHNSAREKPELETIGSVSPTSYPEVDSLVSSFMPLAAAGLVPIDLAKDQSDKAVNTATLSLLRSGKSNGALQGRGSDFIADLVNKGLTKPVNFPVFFGKFWFSCSLINCSEVDFMSAVAQIIDCKLEVTSGTYSFVPNIEKVRARFLKTYQLFGDMSNSYHGLRQRTLYRAYTIASAEIIQESLSNEKMDRVFRVTNDPELKADLEQLVKAAVVEFSNSKNEHTRQVAQSVKEGGEVKIAYGFGLRFSPVVELTNGRVWRF